MAIYVFVSYELAENPGLHSEFKAELEELGWPFESERKKLPLPNTTAWAKWTAGASEKSAKKDAVQDFIAAQATVRQNHDRRFKITRVAFVAFDKPPSQLNVHTGSPRNSRGSRGNGRTTSTRSRLCPRTPC